MRCIPFMLFLTLLLVGCQTEPKTTDTAESTPVANLSKSQLGEKIAETRLQIYDQKTNSFNRAAANNYIAYCEQYATVASDDPEAVKYLFQAGETARSVQQHDRALAIYDRIYKDFSSSPKAPQALFLKAFTMDNDMKQPEKARAIYEEFVAKHPEDDFADDTKFLLENLGKSDEEIIKKFEQ
mgnify:CR=1 FL=1